MFHTFQISNTCLPTDLQRFLPQLESLQLESGLGEGLLPQQLHFLHSCSYPGGEKRKKKKMSALTEQINIFTGYRSRKLTLLFASYAT